MKPGIENTVENSAAPTVPGEGKPRRNGAVGPDAPLIGVGESKSLYENFLVGVKASNGGAYLGHRTITNGVAGPYVWETYTEVKTRLANLGSGLVKLGLEPYKPLGLFSINRPEWVIGELASYLYGFATVPLYDTLGTDAIRYICTQTEMTHVLATSDKAATILDNSEHLKDLKYIVVMDGADEALIKRGKSLGVTVVSMSDVEKSGSVDPPAPVGTKPEDVATICYTSGTTGLPKGVVLTHANILAQVNAADHMSKTKRFYNVTKDDLHISYLPLAHVFERMIQAFLVSRGSKIGFYQGDTLKLLDDVAELKPTIFVSVPRLFNRIYDKVWSGVKAKGGVAAFLFNTAYSYKKAGLARGTVTHWLWDRLVFGGVRSKLGGRVKVMLTGSAPIAADVMDFLRICFSADVYEGYGQTETTAGLTLTTMGDTTSGHVGVPFSSGEVKLVDIPGMNYTSQDKPYPRGEICIKGHQVFREYYKDAEKTAETLDKDGWCHTGDVGQWDSEGRLCIIDRVKNIFKLAQGEYIAPERIEGVYQKHELVAQAFVHGDSLQATLVAVIVPDEIELKRWAAKNNLGDKSFAELCRNEDVKKHILQQIVAFGKANDLKGFENVKNIHLESELWSVENDLFTPTFKLKRHPVKAKYQKQIDAMYAEIQ